VPGNVRPTVSLLFSGGVFRGVFQVGVLNGLNELGIQPDLIAGASVGSITAAMIARAFSMPDDEQRAAQIARIAAVYLSVDRLILTDRFADAVRNLTLRAAEMRFSIRQADRVFRKFDHPTFFGFERNARRVVAGIERLLYVTPYQLNDLVRALRTRDNRKAIELTMGGVQKFLDRMEIGEEALGAEALRDLVQRYVILAGSSDQNMRSFTTDELRQKHGIQFLATTTNLTDGRLEVIGEWPETDEEPGTLLEQALLASSAFPALFRPRWSWELTSGAPRTAQYIDGGVMDNLPVDAIARFLHRAGRFNMINKFPETPHLIVAASLQVDAPAYSTDFIRRRFKGSWLTLRRRAKQLSYNTKLDAYVFAENALRDIHNHVQQEYPDQQTDRAKDLVGIDLLPIKPNWLCGTFGFHPMLGFRREKQARSIAHGCATTLLQFADVRWKREEGQRRLRDWGIEETSLPPHAGTWTKLLEKSTNRRTSKQVGQCWLRDRPCPFSRVALSRSALGLEEAVIQEVSAIHRLCAQPQTHLRRV
jgi:predicted acylesterase/phospholipase RssA